MGVLISHEAAVRLAAFFAVFALMALWELLAPRRPQAIGRLTRWPGNLGLSALNSLLIRLVFPTAAVGMAAMVQARGWGLLTLLPAPAWVIIPLAVIALDLVIYGQHRLFHAVPAFWRLHRLHHADLELDVTSGVRFHPLEMLLSMAIKMVAVAALGAPAEAVVVFELLLGATSLFNHANVRLPAGLDRVLRWLVVTPDMHRVHHSTLPAETNSNFGFNLSLWDRLLGSYRARPEAGQLGMMIGLESFRDPGELRLDRMLTQPLRRG